MAVNASVLCVSDVITLTAAQETGAADGRGTRYGLSDRLGTLADRMLILVDNGK